MQRIPQPIPYQGSKRNIAQQIMIAFPKQFGSLIEPFAGSAALSVATAYYRKANQFYLNDLNKPLMDLLDKIVNQPAQIANAYEDLWNAQSGRERAFYDFIRDEFNKTHHPDYLLYLLARCVKASVRYNAEGAFNQSPDNRRKGRRPTSMRQEIFAVSNLLQNRTTFASHDYKDTLNVISQSDLIYMDPPYQGTSQSKDHRYYRGIDVEELIDFLAELNKRQVLFLLSYDGRTGDKTYGTMLPAHLKLKRFEICAGRSSQATLLGSHSQTYESLYLSPALVRRLRTNNTFSTTSAVLNKPSRDTQPVQLELGIG